jgi:hypothetical protein
MRTPTRPWLRLVAGVLIVLNLVDAIFTLVYTEGGVATEANPLMATALGASPIAFMLAKLALVSFGVLVLWRLRYRRSAAVGLVGAATAYAWLVVHHVTAATRLVSMDLLAIR